MADQELGIRMKTTSDVPDAMGKAKTATVSFGKQVEDIQKKFSTAFKDIFLSFLGPMALLGVAINYIGKLIEDNQRKHSEATQAAIDETNELMSAEDRYFKQKQDRENKAKEKVEQAKMTREDVTREFLTTDPRGRQMLFDYAEAQRKKGSNKYGPGYASEDKAMQEKVQALISEDAKKNPLPVEIKTGESKQKDGSFKGPDGFGAVIGVGANPVMEAMTKQVEVLQEIKVILQESKPSGGGVPAPFTEKPLSIRGTFNA